MDKKIALDSLYYVGIRRMECRKDKLRKRIKRMPEAVSEDDHFVQFHCDIHYPVRGEGGEWLVKTWLYNEETFIFVPRDAIVELKPAGYPKAGILAEKFLDFPWRLLKPIRDYLKDPTSLERFMDVIRTEQVFDGLEVTAYYYDHINPWFESALEERARRDQGIRAQRLKDLAAHYEKAIQLHKEAMLKAF
ncbi:MAG: hypothetical protein ACLFTZ_05005, partial [Acholeplasmataceae bacterium]